MNAYEKLKAARSQSRPTAKCYIEKIISKPIEFHGDRRFADDPAMVCGVGYLGTIPVTYIATERGADMEERVRRNFGCPKPEGYRKALRLMKQAEKFGRPVITFVDTSGAFCGKDAEERGQGQAIAENLTAMMGLKVPILTVVIGEGESGGALGIAVSDRVYMLENAVYSVISPEGCASILWKDSGRAPEMADHLKITAEHMKQFGVVERIIPEQFDRFSAMCLGMKRMLSKDVKRLLEMDVESLKRRRYGRFRKIGDVEQGQR